MACPPIYDSSVLGYNILSFPQLTMPDQRSSVEDVASPILDGSERASKKRRVITHFEKIRKLVEDKINVTDFNFVEVMTFNTWIEALASDSRDEYAKIMEMGLFYSILNETPEKAIDYLLSDISLLRQVESEIRNDILSITRKYKEYCPCSLQSKLPTGKVYYLLKKFTNLVFSDGKSFNFGGAYAVERLLKGPIGATISEEQHAHILYIINSLIKNADFRNLFLNPFELRTFQDVILVDQQLPPGTDLPFVNVQRALLSSLFFLPTQLQEDCFAVAPWIFLQSTSPEKVVKLLIQILTTGNFDFHGHLIPIGLIVNGLNRVPNCFSEPIPMNESLQGIPQLEFFKAIQKTSGCPEIQISAESLEETTLEKTLLVHFEDVTFLKQVTTSLTYPLLNRILVGIAQFVGKNELKKGFSTTREDFLNFVKDFFKPIKNSKKLVKELEKSVYFVKVMHESFKLSEDQKFYEFSMDRRLWVDPDNIKEEYDVFLDEDCLVVNQDNNFTKVYKISVFIEFLLGFIEKNIKDLALKQKLKNHVTENAQEALGEYMADNNDDYSFDEPDFYIRSDALILKEMGGHAELFLEFIETIQDTPVILKAPTEVITPRELFLGLIDYMAVNYRDKKVPVPRALFANVDPWAHAINLLPQAFQEYFQEGKENGERLIEEILRFGKRVSNAGLSPDVQQNIINNLGCSSMIEVVPDGISMQDFVARLTKNLPFADEKIEQAINHALREANPAIIIRSIKSILRQNNIDYPETIESAIQEQIPESMTLINPYQIASIIRNILLEARLVAPSTFELGKLISFYLKLPTIIPFANTNGSKIKEDCHYDFLSLGYNFVAESLDYIMFESESGMIKDLGNESGETAIHELEFFLPFEPSREPFFELFTAGGPAENLASIGYRGFLASLSEKVVSSA